MKAKTRRAYFQIHSWIGLVACLVFAMLGLTGTLIVYQQEIEARGVPAIQPLDTAQRPLTALVATASAAGAGTPIYVDFPRLATDPLEVFVDGDKPVKVLLDPWRGTVVAKRGKSWLDTAYELHDLSIIGSWGRPILGIVGFVTIGLLLTGAVLWWPGVGRLVRSLKVRWHAKWWIVMTDLHKSVGAVIVVVLLVVTVSGLYFVYYSPIQRWLVAARAMEPYPWELTSGPRDDQRVTADDAMALAQARVPDGKGTSLTLPATPEDTYIITFYRSGQVAVGGLSRVWIDQWSGRVLAHRDPARFAAADHVLAWMFPLHNGEAFRGPGRAVIAVSGLIMFALSMTGFVMWWRRSRRAKAGGPAAKRTSPTSTEGALHEAG